MKTFPAKCTKSRNGRIEFLVSPEETEQFKKGTEYVLGIESTIPISRDPVASPESPDSPKLPEVPD